ncbi:MAG: hypothetical protein ACRDTF_05135 [Pseudonocardiaceae bacterium]
MNFQQDESGKGRFDEWQERDADAAQQIVGKAVPHQAGVEAEVVQGGLGVHPSEVVEQAAEQRRLGDDRSGDGQDTGSISRRTLLPRD